MNIDRFIRSCASWDDFSQRMRPLSNGDKGRIFERLTQLYLQTQPKYRTTLRDVWLREEVPSKVRAKLNFPTTDEGIDLIARDRRGKYWSIQAKWRTETNQALTLSLTDSFTRCSFVTCRKINFALIADNKTKPIAKSKFLRNMGEIGFDGWASADWSLITRAIKDKRPVAPKPATPRLDQLRAIEAAKVHFLRDKQSRGRLIAPCGTGKSLDGFWIAEALKAKTVVVIVPNLGLIEQGVRDWMKEFLARGRKPEWICICSDDSVDSTQKDEIVSSVYATGLPVDTDPKVVADFLRGRTNETKVIFSTYQSGKQLAAAARRAGITLDLVIFDEAHRTVGLRNNTFATLLNARKLKARWRLFMTATERVVRFNGDDEVYSMDNEDDYGKCFFEMNVKEAIAAPAADGTKGIISDYEILTMVVSDHEIKQHIAKNRLLNLTRKLTDAEAREVATGIALKRVYQKHCIGHALSFHRSIAAAKSFSVQQSKLNGIPPHVTNFHVNGGQTAGERKIRLDKYRASPRALMTNARCLQEGIDVPAIDCVVFADPRQSMTDIVQAAGRAMRKADGKKCGYILVPIVVPDKVDFKEFAETTTFRTVMRVIVALAESDDRIKDELRAICHGHVSKGKIIHIDSKLLIGLDIPLEKFAEAIKIEMWKRIARLNWRPFEEAREFVHRLKLKSGKEWRIYCRSGEKPADIPTNPDRIYANNGWVSWLDWLGGGSRRYSGWRTYKEARAFVHQLRLKSVKKWIAYCASGRKPNDIPSNPNLVYANAGWVDWPDWIGNTRRIPSNGWRAFKKARAFVHNLGFKSVREWRIYCRSDEKPADIPTAPEMVYANAGWLDWRDWLGKTKPRNASGFRGIYAYRKTWKAQIVHQHIGSFDTPEEAARAYDAAAIKRWGARAVTNFPRPT